MIDIFRGEVNIRACLFKMCMEKFMIEYPSIMRETDAIDYVNEFKRYNSSINGIVRLDRYLDDYDSWICYLESEKVIKPNEKTGKIESFYNIDTQKSFHKYSDIYCSMVDNIPQNFFMGVVNEK